MIGPGPLDEKDATIGAGFKCLISLVPSIVALGFLYIYIYIYYCIYLVNVEDNKLIKLGKLIIISLDYN